MDAAAGEIEFSLLGGPLHRLGKRLGLVRGHSNTLALGLVLGPGVWLVMVLLAFAGGLGAQLFSVSVVGEHVRLLVAIPFFFVCETIFDPRVTALVTTLVRSRVVPEKALPALRAELARSARLSNGWLPEAVFLVIALAILVVGSDLPFFGDTAVPTSGHDPISWTLTGYWYFFVCLTVVRFLIFRWFWRLFLWCRFLWGLSRLGLHLVPTHPDRQAGLGYVRVVQLQFGPLALAFSAIQSASLAEAVADGSLKFESMFPVVLVVVALQALIFLGPMLILAPVLRAARLDGLERYMELASVYVDAFDKKWLGTEGSAAGEPFLGTDDIQSLADLQNSMGVIDEMQWIPVNRRLALGIMGAALIPLVPLLLLKYPIAELTGKFFSGLIGL
jgi:hypothetical protein